MHKEVMLHAHLLEDLEPKMKRLGINALKWQRRQRDATRAVSDDANRAVAKLGDRGEPLPELDPIAELVRILGEPHENDLRPHDDAGASRADDGSGSLRVQWATLRQLIRPRRPLSLLRLRRPPSHGGLPRR